MTRSLEYTLSPLPQPEAQIRLLYLLAGNEEDEIHVSLSVHDLDEAPEYNAISYTWGDLHSDKKRIFVDGKPFLVGQNCHYALWQARIHHPNQLVWIDAICINQHDDAEKSLQVRMMGRVFAEASVVLACVGPHANDSEYLVQCGFDDLGLWTQMTAKEQRSWLRGRVLADRAYRASDALLLRPYWKRVWVAQEVAVAARKAILCGDSRLLWSTVDLPIGQELQFLPTPSPYQPEATADFMGRKLNPYFHPSPTALAQAGSLDFTDVLEAFKSHRCTDPRDHIYGLLALIKWPPGVVPLLPDYSLTAFELAVKVLEIVPVDKMMLVVELLKIDLDQPSVRLQSERRRTGSLTSSMATLNDFPQDGLAIEHVTLSQIQTKYLLSTAVSTRDQILETSQFSAGESDFQLRDSRKPVNLLSDWLATDGSMKRRFGGRIPKLLFQRGETVGLLCHEASTGDFIAPIRPEYWDWRGGVFWQYGLVLRHLREGWYTIVGQALLRNGSYKLRFRNLEDENGLTLKADLYTAMTLEDLLILEVQDRKGDGRYHPMRRMERLATNVVDPDAGDARIRLRNMERTRESYGPHYRMTRRRGQTG